MKTPIFKWLVSACLFALIAVGCAPRASTRLPDSADGGDPKAAYQEGKAAAQQDIRRGKLVVKTYGLPAPWRGMYGSNLLSRYQIELRPVAGCVVTETLVQSVQGYNEVTEAEIERRYGKGLLERVAKEAEQAWPRREPHE